MGYRRLVRGDETLFRLFDYSISKNEWHALWLGVSFGLITGRTRSSRITAFIALYSLFGSSTTIGAKTIVNEPWYFLVGLSISYILMTD